MKKITLLFILLPFLGLSQVQIGGDIDGENSGDQLGQSVSISSDGSIVAIGAPGNDGNGSTSGHVRVYRNENNNWIQIGQDIDGEFAGDAFGRSLSLSSNGTIIAVGADFNNGNGTWSGHVRVYRNENNSWVQIGDDIDGEAADDRSGDAVSLSGDGTILAIGAPRNDGNGLGNSGHVRVFRNENDAWVQIGDDINGDAVEDNFGSSIALSNDGTVLIIGAERHGSLFSGKVKVYRNENDSWVQIGDDIIGDFLDHLGYSVALSNNGSIIAIGANRADGDEDFSGHVKVFIIDNDSWTQLGNTINGEFYNDDFGRSVALSSDGTLITIGGTNGNDTGHVRVFRIINNSWIQLGNDINGEALDDFSGFSMSLSNDGTILAIGAPRNDGNGDFSGHVRVFDLTAVLSTLELSTSTFKLYPNPAKTQFTIELDPSLQLEQVSIYNLIGQVVLTSKEHIVNTSKLASGSYIVEIITNQGKATKKLIID